MSAHPGSDNTPAPDASPIGDLSGTWRVHASEPDLAKAFADPEFADDAWTNVRVPHHWRAEPAFAESDGPLLYRRHFPHAGTATDRRAFLELTGVYYYADVWLDGEYLGATEGSFQTHAFEVTAALSARADHVLAVEVASPPQRDRSTKRTLTGPYWQSPMLDPALNPGGLWRTVRVAECGPVRIERMRVICIEASVEQGRLTCSLSLDAGETPRDARLHALIRGPGGAVLHDATRDATLATGCNEMEWTIAVDDPPRWWPRGMGPQALCELELTVEVDGEASDRRTYRTAFREVREHHWQFSINGEHRYLKGASYGPTCALPGAATDALVRADLERAVAANLDFLRIHTHVASDALYDAADEMGLLLWQDFPMQGGYARGVRKQAARQAGALVDALGHHPSVFLWCAHDAPFGDDTALRLLAGAALPSWSKEVLDRSVARAFSRRDPSRTVVRTSGGGDDTHAWFGWLHGEIDGLASAVRALPRLGRFVSAFGAQAVPPTADWMQPEAWPELDREALAAHHGMQRDAFAARVPVQETKSFDEWRDATQAYQAALLQLQIEDLRRCRGAPGGGFALFTLVDPAPAVGFGIIDHERIPKRAYASVRDACRPVLPMVDPRTGNVHVVNDTTTTLEAGEIEVVVDGRARRWSGTVEGDAIAFIARAELGDAVDVEVAFTHPETGRVVNRYPLLILEAGRKQ